MSLISNIIGKVLKIGASEIPVIGPFVGLAINLGADQWVINLVAKVITKIFKVDDAASVRLVNAIATAISQTTDASSKGQLSTSEDKQKFAASALQNALKDDPQFKMIEDFSSVAPALIELIYQILKLKSAGRVATVAVAPGQPGYMKQ